MAEHAKELLQKLKKWAKITKKITKNHNETPKICSNWTPLAKATLRSIPNACYLLKNRPERTKEVKKRPKIDQKKGDFVRQNFPLRKCYFVFSPIILVDPSGALF